MTMCVRMFCGIHYCTKHEGMQYAVFSNHGKGDARVSDTPHHQVEMSLCIPFPDTELPITNSLISDTPHTLFCCVFATPWFLIFLRASFSAVGERCSLRLCARRIVA